ncbi:aldehyde dehydrogenase family protein [Streptomyces anatolicus]|uniref:aldehyde dehydrogenase family protein n=1 Tax=Streptomyces anatolicus TaxID=2675858 RepID=UPI0027DF14EF|nr:aldehyde dehydrogenase family protein [Streptomyces anatolicus]
MTTYTLPPDGLPVGDSWVPAPGRRAVTFPYDGSEFAYAPVGDTALARQAVEHAAGLRRTVGALPSHTRRQVLADVAAALGDELPGLVDLLVLETGKPRVDCDIEMLRTVATWQAAADEVAHLHGETVPLDVQPSGEGLSGSGRGGPSASWSASRASTTPCCWPPTRSPPRSPRAAR